MLNSVEHEKSFITSGPCNGLEAVSEDDWSHTDIGRGIGRDNYLWLVNDVNESHLKE